MTNGTNWTDGSNSAQRVRKLNGAAPASANGSSKPGPKVKPNVATAQPELDEPVNEGQGIFGTLSPDDINALVQMGLNQGYLTQEQVLAVLPTPEMNVEQLDEVFASLIDIGIDVIDDPRGEFSVAPTSPINLARQNATPAPPPDVELDTVAEMADEIEAEIEAERASDADINLELESISIDDPVRMYLREIGRVPLLSADAEVSLAKRMERGEYLLQLKAEVTNLNPARRMKAPFLGYSNGTTNNGMSNGSNGSNGNGAAHTNGYSSNGAR